jgi:hypothetical protein
MSTTKEILKVWGGAHAVAQYERESRESAAANWDAGYDAHRRGEQRHNPYRLREHQGPQESGTDPLPYPHPIADVRIRQPTEQEAAEMDRRMPRHLREPQNLPLDLHCHGCTDDMCPGCCDCSDDNGALQKPEGE